MNFLWITTLFGEEPDNLSLRLMAYYLRLFWYGLRSIVFFNHLFERVDLFGYISLIASINSAVWPWVWRLIGSRLPSLTDLIASINCSNFFILSSILNIVTTNYRLGMLLYFSRHCTYLGWMGKSSLVAIHTGNRDWYNGKPLSLISPVLTYNTTPFLILLVIKGENRIIKISDDLFTDMVSPLWGGQDDEIIPSYMPDKVIWVA